MTPSLSAGDDRSQNQTRESPRLKPPAKAMKPSLTAGPKRPKAGDNQIQAVTDPSSGSGHSETAEEPATKDEILEVDF